MLATDSLTAPEMFYSIIDIWPALLCPMDESKMKDFPYRDQQKKYIVINHKP